MADYDDYDFNPVLYDLVCSTCGHECEGTLEQIDTFCRKKGCVGRYNYVPKEVAE